MDKPTFAPEPYSEALLNAWRAIHSATANEGQMRTFSDWLLKNLCHVDRLSYRTTQSDMSFLEGQRSIGVLLERMLGRDGDQLLALFKSEAKQAAERVAQAKRIAAMTRGKRGKPE